MSRIGLENLPPLRKGFSLQFYTESKEAAMQACQQDILFYNNIQSRDEINDKILKRLNENEIQLAKEIRKKQILLQKNIEHAVKTLKKVQVRIAFWDKVNDQQRNTLKAENYLCYTNKGNSDGESKRDRTSGGRIHERQQEEFKNLVIGKDDIEKQKNSVKETNASQKATRREETEWEYKGRNTHKTTKTVEKEREQPEKMTCRTRQSEQTENNKTRGEKVVEWQQNEIREWDQKTEENEMVSVCDGEKRRHKQADRQITCSSPPLRLPPLNSSQHQANCTVPKEMLETNDPEPLPDDGPSTQNIESLQQEQLIPESGPGFQLVPCEICHRKFKEDRLERHISICQKTQKPKRKVYDSSRHRIKGTELEEFIKKNGRSKTPENTLQARAPADRPVKQRQVPYSDYVTCPHCTRRFAPGTAERHIEKCQNIKSRPPPPKRRLQV